ncbi:MAG: lipopolysaccharide heptosyltransferase II, partial [Nitrospirota bacterium]|nr:lipopolysaccharide heptosyltransferase II [Nitrospirota bacterium]
FDAALIAFLSGIPQRIGYNRDWRGFLLTDSIPFNNDDRKIHHIEYYLNILRQAGIDAEFSLPYIYLSLNERIRARDTLKGLKRPVVGINPGASYGSTKRWQPEKFAEVTRKIISEFGGSVVIFGGQSETGIAEEIASSPQLLPLAARVLLMAGKTDLRELSALISECDTLLTNDSGPMHIGYAVRTPMAAIFGSTDPELTGPLGKGNIVIKKNIECSPCFERTCGRNKMDCMDAITTDDVFDAIERSISKNKAVFFDRDGTLCKDAEYLNSFDNLEIFKELSELIHLKDKGYKLIGVSNQSGIARRIVDEKFTREVNNIFIEQYGFDDFYYCPHRPDEHCPCRKPEPEMLLRARAAHSIDLKQSYVIGDKEIDMLLAKSTGAKGILVLTGQGAESANADYVAKDLNEAVKWILGNP